MCVVTSSDVVIIGAGAAALGTALALGNSAIVLGQAGEAGGIRGTVYLAGAIFDLGGHSVHTPHREIRDLVRPPRSASPRVARGARPHS
jgi:protoporphyrinogen oxidase